MDPMLIPSARRQTLGISIGSMDHQGRRHRDVPQLCGGGKIETAAEHHPQGFRRTPAPAGEEGVIGADRPAPHDHGIHASAQLMHPVASG